MTDDNNTASDAIQTDDDILTPTVSDEAIEAAAGGRGYEATGLDTYTAIPGCPYCQRCDAAPGARVEVITVTGRSGPQRPVTRTPGPCGDPPSGAFSIPFID
jgi:hypothetical protein